MFYEVVMPLLGMAMGAWVLYNGFRIANRALNQKHERDLAAAGEATSGEVAELRDRLDRLEEVGQRVQELEERLDFTERVLTSGREQTEGPS